MAKETRQYKKILMAPCLQIALQLSFFRLMASLEQSRNQIPNVMQKEWEVQDGTITKNIVLPVSTLVF